MSCLTLIKTPFDFKLPTLYQGLCTNLKFQIASRFQLPRVYYEIEETIGSQLKQRCIAESWRAVNKTNYRVHFHKFVSISKVLLATCPAHLGAAKTGSATQCNIRGPIFRHSKPSLGCMPLHIVRRYTTPPSTEGHNARARSQQSNTRRNYRRHLKTAFRDR